MTLGMTLLPALARASAVRGMSFTLSLRPKLFVPAVGMVIGPVAVVGRGAGSDSGVMELVIRGAVGRVPGSMTGRLVSALVAAFRTCGGAGGLVARSGSTEAPGTD